MTEAHETYSFADFTVDVTSNLLFKGKSVVLVDEKPFGGRPFDALVYLVRNPNRLITDDELINAVSANVTNDAARKWIEKIQPVLGDHGHLIQRVAGKGWRLAVTVTVNGINQAEATSVNAPALVSEDKRKSTSAETARAASRRPLSYAGDTFEGWVSESGLWLVVMLALCVALTFVITLVRSGEPEVTTMRIVARVQCVVILLLLLHSLFWRKAKVFRENKECREADILQAGFESRDEFEKIRDELEADLRSFTYRWWGLLGTWILLYLVFAFGDMQNSPAKVLQILFNLSNTLAMLLCFDTLNKDMDRQDDGHFSGKLLNYIVFIGVAGVIGAACFTDLEGATVLTGISAGITMALFVGRLQSKFLRPRFWVIYLLYSYTAIQPLALYIQEHARWGIYILDFALFLKCLLYLFMSWLFQSGLLLFYLLRARETDTSVRDQRQALMRLVQ